MSEAIFHKDLLSNYQLVTKPGTYYVSTAYTVTDRNLIADENPRYVVPLRALTGEGLAQLIPVLDAATDGIVLFSTIRKVFLSGAIWLTDDFDEKDLPIRGEKLLATFDYVDCDGENRLLCTHIELLPREELDYVDVSQLDQFRLAIATLITKKA